MEKDFHRRFDFLCSARVWALVWPQLTEAEVRMVAFRVVMWEMRTGRMHTWELLEQLVKAQLGQRRMG